MKITVINGTEIKGCTYHIKEEFLTPLKNHHEITEFYLPRDMPHFCCGCKNCFLKDTSNCPHNDAVEPIWRAIMEADLLVLTSPCYGLGITAGLKALLDHFCVHWMVHRPEPKMFAKSAVILTNCVGASFLARGAQRDAVNALSWMGVSRINRLAIGLLEGVIWNELSEKRRENIIRKARRLGMKYIAVHSAKKSLKVRFIFFMSKVMHKAVLKSEETPSADNRHWIKHGWI